MTEALLGFDIRILSGRSYGAAWGKEYRHEFLINPDIEFPVSVDIRVTPSIFCFATDAEAQGAKIVMGTDSAHRAALRLWESLWAMESHARERFEELCQGDCRSIAITVLANGRLREDPRWRDILEERLEPSSLDQRWRCFGYDVADKYLMSGMSNCAYTPEEMSTTRLRWRGKINSYGLLPTAVEAESLRLETEDRVKEHSPFFVFGLYGQS